MFALSCRSDAPIAIEAVWEPPLSHAIIGEVDHSDVPAAWSTSERAVAVFVPKFSLDGNSMKTRPLSEVFCAGEFLASKPAVGVAGEADLATSHAFTGFLVTDRHVVTAAHAFCVERPSCTLNCAEDFSVVFGYAGGDDPTVEVFTIKSIVASGPGEGTATDWAIVELDRPVRSEVAEPLAVAAAPQIDANIRLAAIAYPWGTPRIFAYNAQLLPQPLGRDCFQHTLDSTPGFSGSPLFAEGSPGSVIGMNLSGGGDYECAKEACLRMMACPDNGNGCDCNQNDTTSIPSTAFADVVAKLVSGQVLPDPVPPTENPGCFVTHERVIEPSDLPRRSAWARISEQAEPATCDNLQPGDCTPPGKACTGL